MNYAKPITPAVQTDSALMCCHCDTPRADLVAWCPSCAEVTESYALDDDPPLMLNLAARLDEIAARRTGGVS